MDRPEARGSPRKPTEAKNGPIPPRNRIFPGNSALELWVAVPDPLKWPDRKPAEAKNTPTPPRIRIFPGNSALELRVSVPDTLTWTDRKPTEAHGS